MERVDDGRSLYRSRRGMILGVCRGLAEYFAIPVFWMRIAALAALLFSSIWPVLILYLVAAVLLKPEPGPWAPVYRDQWLDMHCRAARACRRAADSLDARMRRMEERAAQDLDDWDTRLHGE